MINSKYKPIPIKIHAQRVTGSAQYHIVECAECIVYNSSTATYGEPILGLVVIYRYLHPSQYSLTKNTIIDIFHIQEQLRKWYFCYINKEGVWSRGIDERLLTCVVRQITVAQKKTCAGILIDEVNQLKIMIRWAVVRLLAYEICVLARNTWSCTNSSRLILD